MRIDDRTVAYFNKSDLLEASIRRQETSCQSETDSRDRILIRRMVPENWEDTFQGSVAFINNRKDSANARSEGAVLGAIAGVTMIALGKIADFIDSNSLLSGTSIVAGGVFALASAGLMVYNDFVARDCKAFRKLLFRLEPQLDELQKEFALDQNTD